MWDVILTVLILVLLIGWFSLHGPVVGPEERGLGPGEDQVGESPLVVSGAAAEIVAATAAQGGERETEPGRESDRAEEPEERQEPGEEKTMGDASLILVGCAVGVAAVLIGEAAALAVVAVWKRIHNNT